MNQQIKPRITAAVAVALLTVAALIVLMNSSLNYSSDMELSREWPPVDSAELLFANEFVAAGEVAPVENPDEASAVAEGAPNAEAHDLTDGGAVADVAPQPVATDRESAMKVKKQHDKPTGPTKEELAERQKAKAREEASSAISKRVNFGGAAAGGNGNSAPAANGSGGSTDGVATASVGGRSMEKWSKPSGRAIGSITVRVSVDRQGKVIRADYQSGSGPVASQQQARRSCEQAAMKSQFSVALDGPAVQQGFITYRFR